MKHSQTGAFLKNSGWVTLGQLGTSLTAFLVITVLANIVSKETLGEYRYVLALVTILGISTLPGLDTALVQSTAKGFSGQLQQLVAVKKKWGFLGLIFGLAIAIYFFFIGNETRAITIVIVSLLVPLYGSYFVYFFYLQGKKNFFLSSVLQLLSRVFFAVVVLGVAFVAPEPLYLILAFMVATIFTQYLSYHYVKQKVQEDNVDPQVISYGKHLTGLGALNILVVNIDKILVGGLLGVVPLAVYTVATLLPQESIRAGRIIAQVTLPTFSSKDTPLEIWRLIPRLLILEVVLFFGWIVYALAAPLFYSTLFPQYTEVVPYTIVAMLIVLTAPAYVLRSLFIAKKFTQGINVTLISVPVIKTLILLFGLVGWGLWGAIWALVVGGLVELLIHFYMYALFTRD